MQQIIKSIDIGEDEINLINQYSRRALSMKEIYTFSVVLCDNEIDRDGEAFTEDSLQVLAKLFIGKTGIFDHNPSGKNQTARIFSATVEPTNEMTSYGEPKMILKARAYMVRNERCQDMILEIDAGILKEVSVSCQVKDKICSICKQEYDGVCGHQVGQQYEGRTCFIQLCHPIDAYEWSFVAVPAQPGAGVVKGYRVDHFEMEKQAQIGRRHMEKLRGEVVRLAYLGDFMKDSPVFTSIVKKMDEKELTAFLEELCKKSKEYCARPQLVCDKNQEHLNSDFKI